MSMTKERKLLLLGLLRNSDMHGYLLNAHLDGSVEMDRRVEREPPDPVRAGDHDGEDRHAEVAGEPSHAGLECGLDTEHRALGEHHDVVAGLHHGLDASSQRSWRS